MEIPSIQFNKKALSNNKVEIIELESLYKRLPSLDHNPTSPHRVNFYLLIYIAKGTGKHLIDFKSHSYEAGSFIFINKHQVQAFDFKTKPCGTVVLFTQEFANEISMRLQVPIFSLDYLMSSYSPVFTVSHALKETSEALLLEITKETNDKDFDMFITQLLFSSLLFKLLRERPRSNKNQLTNRQIKNITFFLKLVERYYTASRSASFYAEKMNISYKSLNQLCKLATQKTTKQLIDEYTILEIKRSLIVEKVEVKEVAYNLSFYEVTNFIKYFKKHTLLTPSQFKINHE